MKNDLQKIAALLAATEDHHTRGLPYVDGSQSPFLCSCGEKFVPSPLATKERAWPSILAIHQALMRTTAVTEGELDLTPIPHLGDSLLGSVYLGTNSKLYRRIANRPGMDDNGLWLDQEGRIITGWNLLGLNLAPVWVPNA